MARAKRERRAASAADRALARPAPPTDSEIARRAYDLYLARGCEHGHDTEDWLQAERELRGMPSSTAT